MVVNHYQGLFRGPIDHEASSVINVIANDRIQMGSTVKLIAPPAGELLPRVTPTAVTGEASYGIVVGGDNDGIFNDGSTTTDPQYQASLSAGQGVVVVTQGRCSALTTTAIAIGDKLTASVVSGYLQVAAVGNEVLAIALQASPGGDIIAVDVQREKIVA